MSSSNKGLVIRQSGYIALSRFSESQSNCPSCNEHIVGARFWASASPTFSQMNIALYSTEAEKSKCTQRNTFFTIWTYLKLCASKTQCIKKKKKTTEKGKNKRKHSHTFSSLLLNSWLINFHTKKWKAHIFLMFWNLCNFCFFPN